MIFFCTFIHETQGSFGEHPRVFSREQPVPHVGLRTPQRLTPNGSTVPRVSKYLKALPCFFPSSISSPCLWLAHFSRRSLPASPWIPKLVLPLLVAVVPKELLGWVQRCWNPGSGANRKCHRRKQGKDVCLRRNLDRNKSGWSWAKEHRESGSSDSLLDSATLAGHYYLFKFWLLHL